MWWRDRGQPEAQVPPPSSRACPAPPRFLPSPSFACSEAASRAAPQPRRLRRVSADSGSLSVAPRGSSGSASDFHSKRVIGSKKDTDVYNGLLDSEGEGEGGMTWENGIVTCILSCKNRIASLCLTQDTACLGRVHGDHPERCYGERGGRGVHVWEHM